MADKKQPPAISNTIEEIDSIIQNSLNIEECFSGADRQLRAALLQQAREMDANIRRAAVNMDESSESDALLLAIVQHVNKIVLKQLDS